MRKTVGVHDVLAPSDNVNSKPKVFFYCPRMSDYYGDILAEISSPVDLARNIEQKLPKILEILENDSQSSYFLQVLTTLLGPVLNEINTADIENKILRPVLPTVKCVFTNCVDEVNEILENNSSYDEEISISLSKILQVCLDILSGFNELMECVASKDSLRADEVLSLHKTIFPILTTAFAHCRDSEETYGAYFAESTSILTSFFKKSYETKTKYYKLLDDLIFNTEDENGVNLLIGVLESVCSVCEIVVALDIKSSVDSWRPFGKLAQKYADILKNKLSLKTPLTQLSQNLNKILNLIMTQDFDEKFRIRYLKIGSFLFKIIIKLCDLYENFDGGILFDLVLFLCRYITHEKQRKIRKRTIFDRIRDILCPFRSHDNEVDEKILSDIERHISVGVSPLLSSLIYNKNFAHTYQMTKSDELDEHKILGYFFLTLLIMKTSLRSNQDKLWSEYDFIESIFRIYEKICLKIEVTAKLENEGFYKKMISTMSAFVILTYDQSRFSEFQVFLVEKIFSRKIQTSILASDLLCTICRLTSDLLCFDTLKYFCDILSSWTPSDRLRPEYIIAGHTSHRLLSFLPKKCQDIIFAKYSSQNNVCYWIGKDPQPLNFSINDESITTMKICLRNNNYCLSNFSDILKCLQFWLDECKKDEFCTSWSDFFLTALLKFTAGCLLSLKSENFSSNFTPVLSLVEKICNEKNTNGKIAAGYFLKRISNVVFQKSEIEMKRITSILTLLLSDGDIFVREIALEAISGFSSTDEDVVRNILTDPNLLESVTYFLQKITTDSSGAFPETVFVHKCARYRENDSPPAKKKKVFDNNVLEALKRIKSDLKLLKEASPLKLDFEMRTLFNENLNEFNNLKSTMPNI